MGPKTTVRLNNKQGPQRKVSSKRILTYLKKKGKESAKGSFRGPGRQSGQLPASAGLSFGA